MSIEATTAVLNHSKHSGTAKLVMVCIAYHYNNNFGAAWPSVETLMQYCNVSKQSIHNALTQLKDSGELVIEYKTGPHGCNMYRFNLPDITLDYVEPPSSQLDSQASLTVKPALLRQSSQLDGTVKPPLPEPLITVNKPLISAPKKVKPKSKPAEPREDQAYFSELARVCQYDTTMISSKDRGALNQAAKKMRANNIPLAKLTAFEKWWYANDWRGHKGQPPTLPQISSEWGKFVRGVVSPKLNGNGHQPSVQNHSQMLPSGVTITPDLSFEL